MLNFIRVTFISLCRTEDMHMVATANYYAQDQPMLHACRWGCHGDWDFGHAWAVMVIGVQFCHCHNWAPGICPQSVTVCHGGMTVCEHLMFVFGLHQSGTFLILSTSRKALDASCPVALTVIVLPFKHYVMLNVLLEW